MFAEDLTVFFREFATPVTAPSGDGFVVFRAIYAGPDMPCGIGGMVADVTKPRLLMSAESAARLACEMVVAVSEIPGRVGPVDFRVLELMPDGTGCVVAVLAPHTPRNADAAALHADLLDDSDE